jgi:hypothetical protein
MVAIDVLWLENPLDYASRRWIRNVWTSGKQMVLPHWMIFACAKKNVRNRAKLEGCMASGYMCDEALQLGFTTKCLALYPHTRHRIWDVDEEEAYVGEVLSGNGWSTYCLLWRWRQHLNMLYQTLWPHKHYTCTIELTCSIVFLLLSRLIKI